MSAIASAAALVVLAGCGGGGDDSSSTSSGSGAGAPSGASTPATTTPTLAAATAVIDGTTIGASQWPDGSTASGGSTGQPVGGLSCAPAGASYTYSHLSIYQNGKQLALPANIGTLGSSLTLQRGCVYPVHTDDASGKIRIDATTNTQYTLGQFFAVWGEPLSSTNVAGVTGPVTAWVNTGGALTKYTGDLSSLVLPRNGEVTLEVGTPLTQIPTYTWTNPPALAATPITLTYGGTVGSLYWPDGSTSTGGKGSPVDGVICGSGMTETYHVHTHLSIVYNGQARALPANIGLPGSCNYELHTHDNTGIIHVETPYNKVFTLGQFFDIWGEPLTVTNVAGLSGDVVVYIRDNGDIRRYMGDPRNIQLGSLREITLQVGTPPISSIAQYNWYEAQ
ncbi:MULTISPECIES: hypothetical protein [unclassified Caballeronia]|uniref:hypothetical protein n=1 Tax=unclassified Caballeronia TaxID=2646786 RepID=UPI0028560497|nr:MULTISPECIES: hypothetical protein [unclassified Caballeronia]MDR5739615.1 hypothetical protein [Caballeronia sp. LZ016]MDR5808082.1 hypothetical protein [Caballeronia sp. LZ019]